MVLEFEKSNEGTRKPYMDESEKERLDRKYEKRIEEYKELYEKEKEKSRKLKEENSRLRMEMDSSSFIQGNSGISYVERPSFS